MFSMEDDIPAVRRLMWGLILAVMLITAAFSARLYLSLGPDSGNPDWLESAAVVGALMALSAFAAGVNGHLRRLRQMEEATARQRLEERMAKLNRKERQ